MGYLVLGDIIEQKTGMSYEKYVTDSILAPLGIYDMKLGKNLLANKLEREGEYVGNNGATTLSCYGDGTYVPWEYGGFSVEAMDAHGGWIASSRDMLKLLTAVDSFTTKPDILSPATIAVMTTPSANNPYYAKGWSVNSAYNWWHLGSLDGTESEWVRTRTGYTWIIICNKRMGGNFENDLDNLGWNCINSTSTWPTWDLMASPTVNAADISFSNITDNAVTLNWTNGNGGNRIIVASQDNPVNAFPLDGTDYTTNNVYGQNALGSNYVVYNGTGNSITVTGLAAGRKYYFRVMEYNKNTTTGNNALYLLGANPQSSVTTSASLPIKLSSFTGVKINNAVKLDWTTQEEMNSGFFNVERSTDGVHFTTIGMLDAQGNTQEVSVYTFTDNNPQTGKNFYRLKETDLDGTSTYSGIVSLSFNTKPQINVVTYEGKNYFSINKNADYNFKNAKIVLRDIAGRPVLQHALTNASSQTVYTSALAKGIYIATIYDTDARLYTQKILLR
ncbi:MAG: serine hydrolase [Agriterribacter sp.]